jgi:hypothetical protein
MFSVKSWLSSSILEIWFMAEVAVLAKITLQATLLRVWNSFGLHRSNSFASEWLQIPDHQLLCLTPT